MPSLSARDLVAVALMAALTAVGAWIRLPLPYVPATLQPSFVYLSGVWLGARRGALAQLVYLGAGLLGFPLFAKGGGPHYVFEPSFGYLCGFAPAAFAAGALSAGAGGRGWPAYARLLAAAAATLPLVYAPGIIWLYIVLNHVAARPTSAAAALALGLATLPKDLLLVPVNAYLGLQLRRHLAHMSD